MLVTFHFCSKSMATGVTGMKADADQITTPVEQLAPDPVSVHFMTAIPAHRTQNPKVN